MIRWFPRRLGSPALASLALFGALGAVPAWSSVAYADEEDDLQRQIEAQKASVADLVRLDTQHAAGEEIVQLKGWLDEAWGLRAKHEYDSVREVLDRCMAQAELIRQSIAAANLKVQVAQKETLLKQVHEQIAQAKKDIESTKVQIKSLERVTP
jgi:hypothetical protein